MKLPRIQLWLGYLVLAVFTSGASAQTASNIFNFDFAANGSQGTIPYGGLVQASDGNLYGTTSFGGAFDAGAGNNVGLGVVFRLTPSGQFTVVYECPGNLSGCYYPQQLIQLPDGNLYGVANNLCAHGFGCLFRLTLAGVFTDLYDFADGTDGAFPQGPLIYTADDMLYGVTEGDFTQNGGMTSPAAYGTVFSYKVGLKSGGSGFKSSFAFGPTSDFGFTPWSGGLTMVNGNLYGTTRYGPEISQTNGYGALWYLKTNSGASLTAGAVLHDFTGQIADGGYPTGGVRYYQPDGNLYGLVSSIGGPAGDAANYGTIYKSGLTSGFSTLYAFPTVAYPEGEVAFDSSGDLLFTQFRGGINSNGALDYFPRNGTAAKVLFSYTNNADGSYPYTEPFFDNAGHLWNYSAQGANTNVNLGYNGSVDEFSISTETAPPITMTASPAKGAPGSSTTLTWAVNNAFSDNEQLCFAASTPADSEWTGIQAGTYSGGVLSGSKQVMVSGPKANLYTFSITCGGTETAQATLATGTLTTTTLTAMPDPVLPGANVKLTAKVTKSGTGTPTGTVSFMLGTDVLETQPLPANGVASFTAPTTGIPNGDYDVTAAYSGDDTFIPSTSAPVDIAVKYKTTTTLTISPNPIPSGATVTLTATVAASSGTAGGNVTFSTGASTLATVALSGGKAVLKAGTSGFPAGTYPIVATYAGSVNDAGSASAAVNAVLQ